MPRLIAPVCRSASSDVEAQRLSSRIPTSLLNEQVRRLSICAAVGAGLWAYGMLMDLVARPLTLGTAVPVKNVVIEAVSIALSAVMLLYARYSRHSAQTKVDAALVYFVLNAAAIALLNNWRHAPVAAVSGLLSWNTIGILVAAMIIPASPRKILIASIVAASTDPLAVWIAHLRGADVPAVIDTLVLFMPNYACAAVAVLPSHVLQRIGQRLKQAQDMGSYHLEELLGRGGMGEVWRASHRLLARGAAIKLVRPELMGAATPQDAESLVRRFQREAQATANLQSPHTIRLFDFGVTDDRTFYYVMELLAGQDLDTLVRASGPLPAERVVYLLKQVCHSLAEAHAHGFVHRDITPRNIYVCRMGLDFDFVKVLDFGLVSFSDPSTAGQSLMTGAHTTTGTPAFMAPEVILEGAVDARADIYALGCVAYYLLTGQLVFEADTPMKMFVQHLQSAPVPPSERGELPIPPGLDALVLACLAKDPADRPQTVSDLLRRLEQLSLRTAWTNDAARTWWEQHLVELAGPAVTGRFLHTTLAVA
ncbi:MAG TPA: serine/threonine-protein kinase [Vicinamibacterales bacterium]|nr:serine/threonine-protein kinase [Vicinamibacterales bacterium]